MKEMTLRNLKHALVAAEAALKLPSIVVDNDAKLAQDHSTDRASFQGRFRKTVFGDFKNRPGRSYEMTQAQIEDHEREDQKVELETAAAATGVVLEAEAERPLHQEIDLHRFADDGGPVHE